MIMTQYVNVVKIEIIYEDLFEEIRIGDMVKELNLDVIENGIRKYRGQNLPYQIITGKKSNISKLIYHNHIPMILNTRKEKPLFKSIYFNVGV